jgi:hypothetical protein
MVMGMTVSAIAEDDLTQKVSQFIEHQKKTDPNFQSKQVQNTYEELQKSVNELIEKNISFSHVDQESELVKNLKPKLDLKKTYELKIMLAAQKGQNVASRIIYDFAGLNSVELKKLMPTYLSIILNQKIKLGEIGERQLLSGVKLMQRSDFSDNYLWQRFHDQVAAYGVMGNEVSEGTVKALGEHYPLIKLQNQSQMHRGILAGSIFDSGDLELDEVLKRWRVSKDELYAYKNAMSSGYLDPVRTKILQDSNVKHLDLLARFKSPESKVNYLTHALWEVPYMDKEGIREFLAAETQRVIKSGELNQLSKIWRVQSKVPGANTEVPEQLKNLILDSKTRTVGLKVMTEVGDLLPKGYEKEIVILSKKDPTLKKDLALFVDQNKVYATKIKADALLKSQYQPILESHYLDQLKSFDQLEDPELIKKAVDGLVEWSDPEMIRKNLLKVKHLEYVQSQIQKLKTIPAPDSCTKDLLKQIFLF